MKKSFVEINGEKYEIWTDSDGKYCLDSKCPGFQASLDLPYCNKFSSLDGPELKTTLFGYKRHPQCLKCEVV